MVEETHLAYVGGYENPVHNSLQETHDSYNECADKMTNNVKESDRIVIASHNAESISIMIDKLNDSDEPYKKNITFGQLHGMGDHLTYTLLNENFPIVKVVPWGEGEVMLPYLLRRGQENKQMLGAVYIQIQLIHHEFMKRIGIS